MQINAGNQGGRISDTKTESFNCRERRSGEDNGHYRNVRDRLKLMFNQAFIKFHYSQGLEPLCKETLDTDSCAE